MYIRCTARAEERPDLPLAGNWAASLTVHIGGLELHIRRADRTFSAIRPGGEIEAWHFAACIENSCQPGWQAHTGSTASLPYIRLVQARRSQDHFRLVELELRC